MIRCDDELPVMYECSFGNLARLIIMAYQLVPKLSREKPKVLVPYQVHTKASAVMLKNRSGDTAIPLQHCVQKICEGDLSKVDKPVGE